jgi:hypothetical protein
MAIIYGVGLATALLIGGAMGLLVTVAHYELVASRQQGYEEEVAEGPRLCRGPVHVPAAEAGTPN